MSTLDGLPPLRDIINAAGLRADKSLGQNFLLDLNLTGKIAQSAGPFEDFTVVEIGPGPGGLTRALLRQGANPLVAVEMDERAVRALTYLQEAYGEAFELRHGNALDLDLAALGDKPIKIVANLPYNVATPLLIGWLEHVAAGTAPIASMTLMFQREVADRITAAPGSRQWGRLGLLAQWLCETRKVLDLPPSAFTPPPKVTSSVVRLTPRPQPLFPARLDILQQVVAAAFNQRRKMLRQSLKSLGGEALLDHAGIDPTRRAETLSIEEFCILARAVAEDAEKQQ